MKFHNCVHTNLESDRVRGRCAEAGVIDTALFERETADSRSSAIVEDLKSSRRSRNHAIFPLNLEDASDLERARMTPPTPAAGFELGSGT